MTRKRLILLGTVLSLVGCGLLLAWVRRPAADRFPPVDDPRLGFDTPFQNVRPHVRYLGDDSCIHCHTDQAETYRHHPMGRALALVAKAEPLERYDAKSQNPFTEEGFQFAVERRGDRVFHTITRPGPDEKPISHYETEVHYALGSGARGRSYLTCRDGYLFQSAISWYSQQGLWALSPGYAAFEHHERPINARCLYCHCNEALPVPNTLNRYREPVFRGHAIGCERCHGPGELHVALRERGDKVEGVDTTIVNPRHLGPELREAVCQQCHLQGAARILRRGRETFDFRPGLPLHLFWSVFLKGAKSEDDRKAVGHVEQMYASRCFRASEGQLGCSSCHDAHALPAADQRLSYYRGRCLTCHEDVSCKAAPDFRRAQEDNCAACHMPRFRSADISHTAITDHRVLRRPQEWRLEDPFTSPPPREETRLVNFYEVAHGAGNSEVASRDLGLAYVYLAEQRPHDRIKLRLGELARPLLEKAAKGAPEDWKTRHARAYTLWLANRKEEAAADYEAALALAPNQEEVVSDLAALLASLGRRESAIEMWQRAIALNPYSAHYHTILARLSAEGKDWRQAIESCRAALRIDPARMEARRILITSYLAAGDRERARAEFETVLGFVNADEQNVLRRWFDEQTR